MYTESVDSIYKMRSGNEWKLCIWYY